MSEVVDTAVNGLGRIGIPYARQAIDDPQLSLLAVGNRAINARDVRERLALDSIHGRFVGHDIVASEDELFVDGQKLPIVDTAYLKPNTWAGFSGKLVVAECTGIYDRMSTAREHIAAGAHAVVLSSPSPDPDVVTIVRGVNDTEAMLEQAVQDKVVAVSSCSTNCIAPVLNLFLGTLPVQSAYAHVTHARTNSQPHLDGSGNKTSTRRSAESLIYAGTGSDIEVARLLPQVPFDADSIRTPVDDGSVARISLDIGAKVTRDTIVQILLSAQQHPQLKGVIETTEHDAFSRGIIGETASALVDLNNIKIVPRGASTVVRLAAWFDNEWGYTNRVREVVKLIGQRL
jgi:glyceraldehyde 3-phosphate dehydrogenase